MAVLIHFIAFSTHGGCSIFHAFLSLRLSEEDVEHSWRLDAAAVDFSWSLQSIFASM